MGLRGYAHGAEVCDCKSGTVSTLWSYTRCEMIYHLAEGYARVAMANGRALLPREGWGSRSLSGFDSVLRGVGVKPGAQAESRVLPGVVLTDNQHVEAPSVDRCSSVLMASGLPVAKEQLVTGHSGIGPERRGFVN